MHDEPMGKPRGTVRAYLAMGIVGAFIAGHVGGAGWLLHLGNTEAALALLASLAVEAGAVTGFYFGSREL